MTQPRLDRIFDVVASKVVCSDNYLRRTLLELDYCEGNSDFVSEREILEAELSTAEMIERLRKALADDEDVLRTAAAKRLVATQQPEAAAILQRFLESERFLDRMELAPLARGHHADAIDRKLIELATGDPVSYVRGAACQGLVGMDPRQSIPVLLQVMHESGDDVDPDDMTPAPAEIAAGVLDEVLGTSLIELRLGNGFATFPPGGSKPKSLMAKAKQVLEALNAKRS